tara:strand:- start:217 stop:675 length:459 start_codon:yes stop_codon:yes gene_type:complete
MKKLVSCFLAVLIVLMPLQVMAEELEGKVTSLSLNERAPYSGILLDPIAASKMVVDSKYLRLEVELELRKEFQKDLAEKTMAYDLLRVDYDSLKKIHDSTLAIKEKQISDLNILLKEEMSKEDHTEWWVLGGVAIGIVLSLGVFYASVEIAK